MIMILPGIRYHKFKIIRYKANIARLSIKNHVVLTVILDYTCIVISCLFLSSWY